MQSNFVVAKLMQKNIDRRRAAQCDAVRRTSLFCCESLIQFISFLNQLQNHCIGKIHFSELICHRNQGNESLPPKWTFAIRVQYRDAIWLLYRIAIVHMGNDDNEMEMDRHKFETSNALASVEFVWNDWHLCCHFIAIATPVAQKKTHKLQIKIIIIYLYYKITNFLT